MQGLEWYKDCYGKDLSLYDLLGICYLKQRTLHTKLNIFYSEMIAKRPNDYRLLFGMAVCRLNADKYGESLKLLDSVINLRKQFGRAYLAKLIIYEKCSLQITPECMA